MLEAHQAELGIDLNQYVYMNKNMNLYVDLLEVQVFVAQGNGEVKRLKNVKIDSQKVSQQKIQVRKNKVDTNDE